ncbi:DUF4949 domain-containing protein [Legionella taurinensis]|uniref:DUF4949 domain-containing protein n=1 Tax=Legionella taurinensis TaxID=70611 RepID=A0A3A5LBD2_9GAMM|nr:DUF4949 domain-containing protein [Legionella taurinensis]RJT47342.1 DUF4949 domain-containing protein [Legionella taurinensis]RJT68617.1 DUF4949 domain-containing protein [Legionella taurinensis]STY24675.1 hemin binding protein Hbp [Legionella taurinensis]
MKFTAKLAAFASALFLASATWAASHTVESCPDVSVIKNEGLSMAQVIMSNTYLTYHISQYNTDNTWVFGIGPVQASDEEQALEEGNALLYHLSGRPSPEDDGEGYSYCIYDLGSDNVQAFALRAADMKSIHQLKKFLHK